MDLARQETRADEAESVVVAGDHVLRTQWIDIDGVPREILDEGGVGELWLKS